MGPRFFKRGEDAGGPQAVEIAAGFNGATLLQAWRDYLQTNTPDQHPRFNGATLLQAWRVPQGHQPTTSAKGLQWGHASSSVESCPFALPEKAVSIASMGPRFFKRGEVADAVDAECVERA